MKSLFILSQYFYPSQKSTAQLMTDLALSLSKISDCKIYVYTSTPLTNALPLTDSRIVVHRFPTLFLDSHSIISKATSSLFFLLISCIYILRIPKDAPLLIISNPPYAGLIGLCFKYLKGGEYIFLFQDIFPESAVSSGILKSHGIVYKSFDCLMASICQQAQKTVVLTPAMQTYLVKKYPHVASKLEVIENWAIEPVIPRPKTGNPFAQQHGLDKIFTVLYSGNIGRLHDIETITEAINLLRDQPIQFVFIGDGPKRTVLTEYVDKYRLSNLLLLPFQPRDQLTYTLTACDLSLASLLPGAESIVAPCKLYGMLAAGRPILSVSSSGSYIDQLITQHNCGINCTPGDATTVAETIQALSCQPERVSNMGRNAHQLYKQQYQIGRAAHEYEMLLFGSNASV